MKFWKEEIERIPKARSLRCFDEKALGSYLKDQELEAYFILDLGYSLCRKGECENPS